MRDLQGGLLLFCRTVILSLFLRNSCYAKHLLRPRQGNAPGRTIAALQPLRRKLNGRAQSQPAAGNELICAVSVQWIGDMGDGAAQMKPARQHGPLQIQISAWEWVRQRGGGRGREGELRRTIHGARQGSTSQAALSAYQRLAWPGSYQDSCRSTGGRLDETRWAPGIRNESRSRRCSRSHR
ncbi:hypothetical protein D3C80_1283060 [compost metagenome]